METNNFPKTPKYFCTRCEYKTNNKKDYSNHELTAKHCRLTDVNTELTKKNPIFVCQKCNKEYKSRVGLWKHKNKCCVVSNNENIIENIIISNEPANEIDELKEFMKYLMKENSDMKSMMMKVIENGTHNTNTTNNNTTTNSHNKAFNLQFFLNETCKDAMNISDFLDSIQLQLSDLENMEEIGFVQGISNIIIKNLNALDVTKRPLHCTDKKRETIYIKDQGVPKGEKDVENIKISGFVKKVAGKNARLLQVFKEKHPDYNQYHSKYSTQYNKLIIEAFGGKGDNDLEKEDKIIRNITKTIVVEK